MGLSSNKIRELLGESGYEVKTVTTPKTSTNKNSTSSNYSSVGSGSGSSSSSGSGSTSSSVDSGSSKGSSSYKSNNEENTWFQKGELLENEFTFGNVFKTILGTVGDVGVNLVKGAGYLLGGVADAATFGVAELAEATGNEEIEYKMRNARSSAESIDEIFAPIDNYLDRHSFIGEKSDSIAQGLGQVGAVILSGGVAGALGAGAAGATAMTTGLMGVSSFGSGAKEALAGGATDEEAATYGLIKGVVDAGSEMIFGGLGKTVKALGISRGLSSLDDMFAKSVSNKITNQVAKNFVQFGVKASAEGVEEVLAGFGSAVGKKLTYMSDEDLKTLVKDEHLLEQFINGAITSGFAQSGLVPGMRTGSLAEANKAGVDFVSGMSANEQKVIDKEVENRVAEKEKEGKVSNREKNKIYEDVVLDMELGRISIDTIEEVLGGETYKTHKDTIAKEKALQDEYNKLYEMKNGEKSDAQIDHQAELKKQLDDIKQNFDRDKLGREVMSLVQNDRLSESYYERSRRGEVFKADVSKFDAKQQATIQKAIDSGILNNTRRTHEFVDLVAKITADKGVSFDFTNNQKLKESGFAVEGATVNGYVTKDGVTLNVDSAKSLNSVVGHEITHVLEGTELYNVLSETITAYAKSKGDYDTRLANLTQLYENVADADVNAELVADLVGDYLFTDADFVHNLSASNRNVFQKIFDEIKYLCKVATAGSKEAKELEKLKKTFEDAYRTATKNTATESGVKYSLNSNAKNELHKALYDTNYRNEVLLRDVSPAIMVSQKGVKNLPMAMNASHIRENVFSEDEAKNLGLPLGDDIHYHALGEDFFLKIIDGLDNVKVAYRGTKNASDSARRENYFLLVSEFKDDAGNTINVPVYVDEHAQINRVFVDVNKISTVFGRDNFQEYINRQVSRGNLVRIKNRDIKTSERPALIAEGYGKDVSNSGQSSNLDTSPVENSVPQQTQGVNPAAGNSPNNGTYSLSADGEQYAAYGNYNVYGSDVAYDPTIASEVPFEAESSVASDFAPVRGTSQKTRQKHKNIPIKESSKGWSVFKDNFVDRGTIFETMSIKSGNRELDAKFRSINRAATSAQYFMKHGNDNTKSLDSIRSAVEKSGKLQKFENYMRHLLNVDRMKVDKPVFGRDVTADKSQAAADKLEQQNPEFKQWADDIYSYLAEHRNMLVESGQISRQTRDLWLEMYPHYIPIRRNGELMEGYVPIEDSANVSVNSPVKRATGGSSGIEPLFETLAKFTEQTFKSSAMNKFGLELKNMLGSTVDVSDIGFNESIGSVYGNQLQDGMPGRNPTFSVFENGQKVTFEITQEMYDTMQPKSDFMKSEFKPASVASDLKRKVITEYNPSFALRNPIKDAQDVLFNSQHAARTYANFPKAAAELMNKNGQYYREYMENGGESVTYFSDDTNSFAKEKSGLSKVIGFPLEAISKVNNFIERIPRMAEYIASREMGRSIDVSMLDAARVTTDFSAGGDLVKWMNRNGFTFLNSSVQGFVQNVRNVREAKAGGLKGVVTLAAKFMIAGLPEMILNNLTWEDDEDYEELSDYIKQNYYVVAKYGDGKFVRIPKGRMAAVISNAFTQMQNLITGDDELDLKTFAKLAIDNLAPNNPLDNNILAPFIQAAQNRAWYGDEILPERLEDLPVSEQFDETTDSLSRWLSDTAGNLGVDISPYKINYVLENTTGILGDYFLPMMTPAAEQGDDSFMGNLLAPIKNDFTADSVLKNQNISDYYDTSEELKAMANSRNATDEDMFASKYLDSIGYEMADLYAQKREIQNSDMSDSEKYEAVREIQKQINALAKKGLASYNDISISGKYAEVADKRYNYDDGKETWYEIKAKEANGEDNYYYQKEQEVTKNLGISYEEYWNNSDLYNDADYYFKSKPGMLDVAKTVFGDDFAKYAAEMSQLKGEDLNGDGQADPYTKQNKIFDYINSLDISDTEKDILRKMNYPNQNGSNGKIIDYLNERTDLSYDDRVNALRGLGFTVSDDGRISNYVSGGGYSSGGSGFNSGKQQKAIERYGITASEYQANPDLYKKADYYFDNEYLDDDLDLEFVANTVFDINEFVNYAAEISQIRGDDLDGDGKADAGTKKKKIFAYIDSLDLPDIEKEILRKMSYRHEKRSNTRIINYLKSREDISDDDRLRVLRGLGFKVSDDGRITW